MWDVTPAAAVTAAAVTSAAAVLAAARQEPAVLLEIVVPALNEAKRLPASLSILSWKVAALPFPVAVLVVDNGSTDGTADVVRGWPADLLPVRLLQCPQRGKGAAVRVGVLATRAPFVGFCDADMATDLSALDVAVSLLLSGCPVVIGSRGHAGSLVEVRHSRVRAAGAAVFRALARVIVPGATDTQCGFKFFSGPLARAAAASLGSTGFAFDIELLARCRRRGAVIREIPVRWRDIPGSTFSVPRHAFGLLTEISSIWVRLRACPDEPPMRAAPDEPPLRAGKGEPITIGSAIRTRLPAYAHADIGGGG